MKANIIYEHLASIIVYTLVHAPQGQAQKILNLILLLSLLYINRWPGLFGKVMKLSLKKKKILKERNHKLNLINKAMEMILKLGTILSKIKLDNKVWMKICFPKISQNHHKKSKHTSTEDII